MPRLTLTHGTATLRSGIPRPSPLASPAPRARPALRRQHHGRGGFYGAARRRLISLGDGEFTEEDLRIAGRLDPAAAVAAFGHTLWAAPPNSQGYLALAGAWIAERTGLPGDTEDGRWAFLLAEAARQAAFDRPAVLHEHANGAALIAPARLAPRAAAVREHARRGLADVYGGGRTTHICAVDRKRMGVSLTMSNAADFGSQIVLPFTGSSFATGAWAFR
jgi:gamma-glutamyltranspeptidase/glutathione hydrolase